MDLRQLARTLRRRWKLVVATFLFALLGSAAVTASITPSYRSDVRVYVTATTVNQTNAYALGLYSEQRIASYANLAKDPSLLRRVIRTAGLNITAEELAGRITATPVPSSVILQISVTDPDPELAQVIARAEADEVVKLVADLEQPSDDPKDETPAPVVARVAGDASFDGFPVSPNVLLNLIIGGLLGVLFGVAGAILRDVFDVSIKSPADAADASGASVMAVIPHDSSVPKRPLISDGPDANERVDAFSVLRTNLQYVDLDSKHQVLVISSALPDEGKTVTSTNLAITIAKTGRRVLILDCDFRKPRVARLLGLENSVGLLTVLVGRAPSGGLHPGARQWRRLPGARDPSRPIRQKSSRRRRCLSCWTGCADSTTSSSSMPRRSSRSRTRRSLP